MRDYVLDTFHAGTLNTSNDEVLRKDDPFDGYKSEISYLTDFLLENSKKRPLFQWGNL